MPHGEAPIARAAMWDNLERFLRAVLPAAEAAGVRLALHPEDPPLAGESVFAKDAGPLVLTQLT